jgi:hypothetical protein
MEPLLIHPKDLNPEDKDQSRRLSPVNDYNIKTFDSVDQHLGN